MINSISYILCINPSCKEVGNIKKNLNKCPDCKKNLIALNLDTLNKYYCPFNKKCSIADCTLIHPNRQHQSPPYISPCDIGYYCKNKKCIFLHPTKYGSWLVRM
jgi:hypothetical protein